MDLDRIVSMKKMGLIDERFPLSAPTYEDWDALTHEDKLVRDSVMATLAAMIDRVDQNTGRLLDKLRSLNKLDNTIILFMSDNGAQDMSDPEHWLWARNKISDFSKPIGSVGRYISLPLSWANVCNTPFRLYKDKSHEGGIATPFIFYWNGKISNPGSITDYPAHFIDIMPTILEHTGSAYLYDFPGRGKINSMDGISLAPLMKGDQPERGRPIYWQWQEDKAIRKDNWKLVSNDNEPWELCDISVDQTETNNVIEEYPDVAKELITDWESWINEIDDTKSME